MPGWGIGSFENDDAQNFLGQLHSLSVEDLREMLARAADQEYVDAPESGTVVAAAEVVASLVAFGKDETASSVNPRQILEWISKNDAEMPPDLADIAIRAVEKVRTNSELKDRWLEAEGLNEWSAALRDLKERLSC